MTPEPTRLHIRRRASVHDDAGNTYGILDVSPDVNDPAILLGIRLAATGERVSLPLRRDDIVEQPGLHLRVEALDTNDVASITLVAVES